MGAGQPLPSGAAMVTGVVVVAGSSQPARRARVTLNATEAGGARSTGTDEDGRFFFLNLPAGKYTLSATKAGHVGVTYGQTQPGRPGTPIQLADGDKFSASLQLPKGSVVTGTVSDEYGDPAPGVQVRVMRYVNQAGRRTLQQSGSGSTDDRGVYRVFGLQPGEYVVSAVPRNTPGLEFDLARLQTDMQSVREQIMISGGRSVLPADVVAALQSRGGAQDEQPSGYAPVYYPGTTAASDAVPLRLAIGDEQTNVDFRLQRVPMARIDGTVVNGTGQPVQNVQLTLTPTAQSVPGIGVSAARVDGQGRFRLANVAPGTYRLIARANLGTAPGGDAPAAGRGGRGGFLQANAVRLWGSVEIPVDGRDITNLIVTLQQGMSVSGRVAFNGTSQPAPADLARLRVTLTPAEPGGPGMLQPAAGTVDANGRFTIPSVLPGSYRLTAAGAGSGWVLESSTIDGQDTLDVPVEIRPGAAVTGALVTFTDQRTELSGAITDSRGRPAPSFTLILYSADERHWTPQSRRIRATRPATTGQFTFADMAPGEYKLVAIVDVEQGAWFDPDFLHQMDPGAMRITLREGEKKVQNLQVQAP